MSGAFDRTAVEEAASGTLGAISGPSATPAYKPSVDPVAIGAEAVALAVSDPDVSDPAIEHLAYFDLGVLDAASRMRSLAALRALGPMLAGGHRSVKGTGRAVLDTDADARVVDVWLRLRDRRWLELGVYVAASTSAARARLLDTVLSRVASLKAEDVPAELLEDCRRDGDRAWRLAADAPNADDVVHWLALGLTLEERAAYRAALKALSAGDVFDLVGRLARPVVTAKGTINAAKE
jgi:hypothetical protein